MNYIADCAALASRHRHAREKSLAPFNVIICTPAPVLFLQVLILNGFKSRNS
jgi:hypothetical protein